MAQNKKLLITGGAGFTGINLLRHFDALGGYDLVALDFADFDYPDMKDKVEFVKGDIRNRALLERAFEGVDYVIHTAMALPLYSDHDIYTTGVEGTRNVLSAALENGVQRVVHISSTAVYGVPDHHPIYEDDRLYGVGAYGQAKIQAELVCLDHRVKGLTVPIIRPKSYIGPERLGVFALLYDWAATGHNFPMIGSGDNPYQLLDVADLCDALTLCLTQPEERANDTFNIATDKFTTMREDFQAVLDHAGHGKKVVSFPAAPAIWGLRALDKLGLSPIYPWVYETASKESYVSIEKAKSQLGYSPKYSNKDALIRNFKWYMANRDQFEGQSGVSHRVPWKQGAIGLAKKVF